MIEREPSHGVFSFNGFRVTSTAGCRTERLLIDSFQGSLQRMKALSFKGGRGSFKAGSRHCANCTAKPFEGRIPRGRANALDGRDFIHELVSVER